MMAPFKRQRQPKMTTQALLDFDCGESSSDSDFRIDDFDSDNSKDDDEDNYDRSSATSSSSADDDDGQENESDKGSEDSTLQLKQLLADANNEEVKKVSKTKKCAKPEVTTNGGDNLEELLRKFDSIPLTAKPKVLTKPICCVCLGDRSDDTNEIVECDGCAVSVHEGCYGVSDNTSISSTNSTCSTEPWFCEACRAGVSEPSCELCPNKGGIYKETDVGKWVHLVCALYVPGVAFGEVDQLSNVTLFEMQYSKWGSKVCSLCENPRFSRTGVCIGCDAGMCKNFFHVTCAQAAGFLTEAHHEDTDAADPFYAHCKVHSEKELIRKRKRNYHTFRLHMDHKYQEKQQNKLDDPCPEQIRINRKLQKYQTKYAAHKQARPVPWVPTQKMSRLLTTSASACRRLLAKANIMEVDVDLMERQEVQVAALTDIRKKWHIAPAFSVEFVAYYLDRISRTKELKEQLTTMMSRNTTLLKDQDSLRTEYDTLLDKNRDFKEKHETLLDSITQIQTQITALCPNKNLINPLNIGRPQTSENIKVSTPPSRPISVPTAAALKMGVGFPLAHLGHPNTKGDSNRLLSTHVKNSPLNEQLHNSPAMQNYSSTTNLTATTTTNKSTPKSPLANVVECHKCGICQKTNDQHLLAKCDTCKLFYHLSCLNPPLTRHPKKSKLYGWQCSECDKSDQSDNVAELPTGPRKSRTRFNKDGIIVPVQSFSHNSEDSQHNLSPKFDIGPGPAKRRSLDVASSSSISPSSSKKLNLNRSLPLGCNELSIKIDNCQKLLTASGSGHVTPKLSKKSKLSLNYSKSTQQQQQQQQSKESPSKSLATKISSKSYPEDSHHYPPPVQPSLPDDEPLLLVLTPKSSTPLPAAVDHDPLALSTYTTATNATTNNFKLTSMHKVIDSNSKQARKQKRKDKHRNKHNLSSDTEKSTNKEHKRKRKKKQHDLQVPNDTMAGIPKIKIKFKTLPLPGEVTPEAKFFYVSADMVRSADEASRAGSVETVEDITPLHLTDEAPSTPNLNITPARPSVTSKTLTNSPTVTNAPAKISLSPRKSSPRKSLPPRTSLGHRAAASAVGGARAKAPAQIANQILTCCVCHSTGVASNSVTCDECRKHYHFTCLDPPVKKTPKIRGYSWHCADCDPTDEEKH